MMLKLLVGALVVGVAHCFSHQNLGLRSAFSRGHLQLSQASPRRFRLAAGRTTNARAVGMMLWGFLPPQKAPREPEPEPTIVEVNNEAELETMLFSGTMTDKLVVVDWYASWCKVCFFLEPRFKKLAREYIDKAIFVKLDAIVLEYNDGDDPVTLCLVSLVNSY
jgi:thiol-disulfide isomerase/thioredoxin